MQGSAADNFEKALRQLTQILVFGNAHLTIGRGVGAAIVNDSAIERAAPAFWGISITAHLDAAQLAAFKLFDKQRGTLTLRHLLKSADFASGSFQKATRSEVEGIIAAARAQIARLEPKLEPLNSKRNKIMAHTDLTVVLDPAKLAQECQVTFTDLEQILAAAAEILNSLSTAYNGTRNFMRLIDDDDFTRVIQLVADAKHAEADRYEEKYGVPAPFERPKRPKNFVD